MARIPILYRFQKRVMKQIKRHKGICLVSLEQGLGKTVVSLQHAYNNPELTPVIVVCPATLKLQWQEEAYAHFSFRAVIASGRKITNKHKYKRARIIIINYDILANWKGFLLSLKPKIIVFDECQMLSGHATKRTKAALALSKKIPSRLALSGTPLANSPWDLFPVLRMLWPQYYKNARSFGMKYCKVSNFFGRVSFKGGRRLKRLHRILTKRGMIRMTKAEVSPDLPKKTESILALEVSRPKEYKRAETDLVSWLKEKDPTKAARAMRALRLVRFGYLRKLAGELILNGVMEWVQNFLDEGEQKLIIFAIHRKIIKRLHKRFKDYSEVIHGGVSMTNRNKAKKKFQLGKTRILICQTKSGGTGLNLTAADSILHAELGWTMTSLEQANDRAHRITSTKPLSVWYAVGKGTIVEKLCHCLQIKGRISEAVLDGKEEKQSTKNIFDLLQKALTKK